MVRSGQNSNSSEILCTSSLPASIKRIGPKATEKRWRHHFPHYKSMGAFCCHGHQSFDPICLKNLMQPFHTPSAATHKINFRLSRASHSEVSKLIRPESKLVHAFMPVLVTSNFDDDSIKNERASMETAFSHYKTMGIFLDAHGQLTP